MSGPTAVPVLPVQDLDRALAWYERLGFAVHRRFDRYAIVTFDGAELHLVVHEIDYPPVSLSGAYLRVADVDATFERWRALGAPVVAPPEDEPYGVREWATEDPDGNLWRIGTTLATTERAEAADDADEMDPPSVSGDLGAMGASARPSSGTDAPPDDAASTDADEAGAAGTDAPEPPVGEPGADGTPTDGSPGTQLDGWVALVEDGERCAGCGLAIGELPARALGAQIRDEAHALGLVLAAADDDAVRRRPDPTTWSALEYGVHVRDLLNVFAERIVRTLAETNPKLGWWDHEAAIEDGMANESFVEAVVDDLGRNAAKMSESLRMVTEDDWERPATRRDGERFTIEIMARFTLHEVVHHRSDAERSLAAAT